MQEYEVQHYVGPPHHPSSHGLKRVIKMDYKEKVEKIEKIIKKYEPIMNYALKYYRDNPHADHGSFLIGYNLFREIKEVLRE